MASPTPEVIVVYDNNGDPLPGAVADMSWAKSSTEAGASIITPAITDIGGGVYTFTPPIPPIGHGWVYVLATGHQPKYYTRYFRPEDYNADLLPDIKNFLFGTWKIFTTGADANRMVFYAPDGITVMAKYDLKDASGVATVFNPFSRNFV
jgi:hypothetical protein